MYVVYCLGVGHLLSYSPIAAIRMGVERLEEISTVFDDMGWLVLQCSCGNSPGEGGGRVS